MSFAALARVGATHEQATRKAFSTLLDSFAPQVDWVLVPEDTLRACGSRNLWR